MKKLSLLMFIGLATAAFQSCNNGNGSINNADSVNEAKNDNNKLKVKEDVADFMVEAANGGMMEVKFGQLAQQNAKDPRVKNFGAMMVHDHSQSNDELKTLASQKNVTLPNSLDENKQDDYNDLKDKKGADFDKAYMDMMVEDHNHDIDEFHKEANSITDMDVQHWVAKTIPTLRVHLDSAKLIQEQVVEVKENQ